MAKLLTAPEAPETLASSGQAIEISEDISSFPRLKEALARELGELDDAQTLDKGLSAWESRQVSGLLEFAFADAQSREVTAKLTASVNVPLVCQRCLEPFDETLEANIRLLFVDDDKAPGWEGPGREGLEPWELDDELLRPVDLVDELLVMAMPFAAMHADLTVCGVEVEAEAEPEAGETIRPFADLRAQMEAASSPTEPVEEQDTDEDQQ